MLSVSILSQKDEKEALEVCFQKLEGTRKQVGTSTNWQRMDWTHMVEENDCRRSNGGFGSTESKPR